MSWPSAYSGKYRSFLSGFALQIRLLFRTSLWPAKIITNQRCLAWAARTYYQQALITQTIGSNNGDILIWHGWRNFNRERRKKFLLPC